MSKDLKEMGLHEGRVFLEEISRSEHLAYLGWQKGHVTGVKAESGKGLGHRNPYDPW